MASPESHEVRLNGKTNMVNVVLALLNDLLVPTIAVILAVVELPSRVQLGLIAGALLWLWLKARGPG